jgi:hypothetical protein
MIVLSSIDFGWTRWFQWGAAMADAALAKDIPQRNRCMALLQNDLRFVRWPTCQAGAEEVCFLVGFQRRLT